MQLKSLIQGLDGIIHGGISAKDFSMVAETDENSAQKILEELIENGIGKINGNNFDFSKGDRLKVALLILKKGGQIDEISEHIDWKDFEGLVAEILENMGFATIRNYIMTKPRMEIDVIGIRMGVAMLIDCKHWRRGSTSALETAVKKQIQRTQNYVSKTEGSIAVPVIVTLYQDRIDFINKVPIVPIYQFESFVDEFYGNLDEMNQIKSEHGDKKQS